MNVYGKTDQGLVRSNNQDTFRTALGKDGCAYLVLCDGMGGARAGNIASEKAAEAFLAYMQEKADASMEVETLAQIIKDAAIEANRVVYELSQSSQEYEGMGTTLVGGIALGDHAVLANIGDSRAYLVDESGEIGQMTEDHSLVQEMVNNCRLTPEEAKTYPGRNLITRAVGVDEEVEPDIYDVTVQDGQTLLLCSDGLSGMVGNEEIAAVVAGLPNLEQACELLIKKACENGGKDNITVVLYTK